MAIKTNYFEAARTYTETGTTVLVSVPSRIIPAVLSAIESRKTRSFWDTDEDFASAYQALTLFQERLLMDAADRIVNEVRALREGDLTPALSRDPSIDPYTLPLTSMLSLQNRVDFNGEQAVSKLEEIRLILEAQSTGEGSQLDALLQIVALLSV